MSDTTITVNNKPYDYIIVRKNIMAEMFGAYLWNHYVKIEVIKTGQITKMDESMLEKIKDKNILIVGGYYKDNMDDIYKVVKNVEVFYNTSDFLVTGDLSVDDSRIVIGHNHTRYKQDKKEYEMNPYTFTNTTTSESNHNIIYVAGNLTGFCTFTLKYLREMMPITLKYNNIFLNMVEYFDSIMYGFSSDEALCFQYGFYGFLPEAKDDVFVKFSYIRQRPELLDTLMEDGKKKRNDNLMVAKTRLACSTEMKVIYNDKSYQIRVAIGDSPIIDSCILLAEHSPDGIGCLIRFDLAEGKKGKTLFSIRKTAKADSLLDMAQFIKHVFGCGGGSDVQAGGSKDGLYFPVEGGMKQISSPDEGDMKQIASL